MIRYIAIAGLLLATLAGPVQGRDRGYPYSIMNPEPGTRASTKAAKPMASTLRGPRSRVKLQHRGALRTARRGSGSVPNLTLPKTQAIPPVAVSPPPSPLAQSQGPTIVPGVGAVPNLPPVVRGRETFQDRAARCHHQMGVYGVPNSQSTAYMGACAN